MQWAINNNLEPGTAIIYLFVEGFGHIKIENQKSGIDPLDMTALQYWQKISTHQEEEEEEYPGLTLACIMIEKYGGNIERIEYREPHHH